MDPKTNTELLGVIQHLQAMTATLQGLTVLLRKMAARTFPELPNGEGIAGEASAGILPAGSICTCGHKRADHDAIMGCCRVCMCAIYTPTETDPRD